MISRLKELAVGQGDGLLKYRVVQAGCYALVWIQFNYQLYWKGNGYAAFSATLLCERIGRSIKRWKLPQWIVLENASLITRMKKGADNILLDAYVKTPESIGWQKEFCGYGLEHQLRIRYPRTDGDLFRQGDLLLLKPYLGVKEPGVLFIQYNDAFSKFVSIYDPRRLAQYYRIVLEPSTWGYCDPAVLAFVGLATDVIVEAQYEADFRYIEALNSNLKPIRIGAGDWIDHEKFEPGNLQEKSYDIVMVASWQRIKRHVLLFDAVSQCKNVVSKIALIGYPSSGRTKEDIVSEAKTYGVEDKIDIYERISRSDVSRIISKSKLGVMLTLREGANKGIYECLFSGVPVIISDRNVGVNRDHINELTGIISSDEALAETIKRMLGNIGTYDPRRWAEKTTGYFNASRMLNEYIRGLAVSDGEEWTQDLYVKKNDTNARYVFEEERLLADRAIDHLRVFLRNLN
jgi:hypothetical protein